MFQSLRQNSPIYIFHKTGNISMETGSVVSVSLPVPKYQLTPVFGQPQEMVVDLVVKVNGQDTTFQKIPAALDIADFGTSGIVLSDSRDAMNAEVASFKNRSVEIVNSVPYHEDIIASCDRILETLNPEYAEKQAQQEEINSLKAQMSELMKMNKELIAEVKGLRTSSKPSKKEE